MSGKFLPFKNARLRVGAFMLMLLSGLNAIAQSENVGIGTTKPDNSALLDLTSTSKGLLIPRMTLAQRAGIKNPANGLMVYQIDFFTGFYFFDGSTWKGLYARNPDGVALAPDVVTSRSTDGSGWGLTGNTGLGSETNFLGTTDTTSLVFKVNNYRSGLIDYRFSNTYFGYRAGQRSHGFNSIAIGAYALFDTNLGLNNIAIGFQSQLSSQTGSDNIALGSNALNANVTGSQNIAFGTQAGQRSLGDGNVFIGYKAGINETGDNKLYIDNNFQDKPLIYGDFETARVGINMQNPESALSIDSKVANTSGLQLKNLTINSPAGRSSAKVLSVNDRGQVILVRDSVGTSVAPPVSVPSYWALKGSSIENSNAGDVILSNLRFKSLRTISPSIRSNAKVLTVDDNGLVVLARDSVGSSAPNFWNLNANNLSNNNAGKLVLNGAIQFNDIKATNRTFRPYGKVLSVDDAGNLILVRDSVGVGSITPSTTPSPWNTSGNNIANSNTGAVYINDGLILSKFNIDNPTTLTAQKFLTVDNSGNVVIANNPTPVITSSSSNWNIDGININNKNTGGVYINNGIWAKNGIRLQSGTLEVNSAVENKSGLQFVQLKAANPAGRAYGKVLSVDDNGNVILVKDSVGVSTIITPPTTGSSPWTVSASDIVNSNLGRVYINNGLSVKSGINVESGNLTTNGSVTNRSGLVLNQLKLAFPASRPSGKVLSVDDNGNVILVRDSVGTTGTVINPEPSKWSVNGQNIANNNTGTVFINNGLTLSRLSSSNTPTVTTQKVLSVDANGNVILVNTPSSTGTPTTPTPTVELWKANTTGGIYNNSTHGISIISNEDGKSGLQLTKLKASSGAGNSYGKVLTVDDAGNVILVNDAVGTGGGTGTGGTAAGWAITDGRVQNTNNGKVVIGTGINSFPGDFQLYVRGGIMTERVRVAVANSDRWADYVFQRGYQLMPLREVEKFIAHHQHLPNVPSAEEMTKNGLDVTETSAKLLEKVEELTLYLIKANKQIEALETKVSNLEKVQKKQ